MSDKPLGSRQLVEEQKKVRNSKSRQQKLSLAAGSLALGSAGLVVAAPVAARTLPKVAPHLKNTRGFRTISRKVMDNPKQIGRRVENYGYRVGTAGGAAGGLGSLNLALMSGREAKIQDSEMNKSMPRGFHYVSLGDISKRASVAVPEDSQAWKMAGKRRDNRWRDEVSDGAKFAYDVPLSHSQRRASQYHAARDASFLGGLAGVGGGVYGITRGKYAPASAALAGGASLVGLSRLANSRSNEWDKAGRKIRARGFQRMLDKEPVGKAFGQLKPTRLPKVKRPTVNKTPGGYVDPPSVTSTPGMPNPAPLRRKSGV